MPRAPLAGAWLRHSPHAASRHATHPNSKKSWVPLALANPTYAPGNITTHIYLFTADIQSDDTDKVLMGCHLCSCLCCQDAIDRRNKYRNIFYAKI